MIAWLKAKLAGDSFLRGVALLVGGTAFAQAVGLAAAPILTRLYSPDDFGTLAVYTSILGMVCVGASLRYESAIPLPDDDQQGANVLALCIGLALALAVLMLLAVMLGGDVLITWVHAPALHPYLWLLPIGFLLMGIYTALNYWAIRKQSYRSITHTRVNQSLSSTAVTIGLGLLHFKPVGLLLGSVVSQSAGIGTLSALAVRQDLDKLQAVTLAGVTQAAVRYQRFAFIAAPAAIINAVGLALPSLLLSAFYDTTVTGHFGLAMRVMGLPLGLIGTAVGQVFLAEAARLGTTQAIRPLFAQTVKRLSLVSLVVVLIGLVGPWAFGFVFGEKWRLAGLYCLILTPAVCAQLITSPVSMIVAITERQDVELWVDASRAILVLAAFIIPHIMGWQAVTALALYSGVTTATYAAYLLAYRHLVKKPMTLSSGIQPPTDGL